MAQCFENKVFFLLFYWDIQSSGHLSPDAWCNFSNFKQTWFVAWVTKRMDNSRLAIFRVVELLKINRTNSWLSSKDSHFTDGRCRGGDSYLEKRLKWNNDKSLFDQVRRKDKQNSNESSNWKGNRLREEKISLRKWRGYASGSPMWKSCNEPDRLSLE